MRRSSNGSSHAGFNNRPRQEEAGKWNWKMEGKSIQARRATQASISLLASSSNLVPHPLRFNPSRPFLFVTLSLLERATLKRAPHIHPFVKLLIPSVFRYSVSRLDATRLSTYVSPRVSLRPFLLEYSSHVFSFFFFSSPPASQSGTFAIWSIILKHPCPRFDRCQLIEPSFQIII